MIYSESFVVLQPKERKKEARLLYRRTWYGTCQFSRRRGGLGLFGTPVLSRILKKNRPGTPTPQQVTNRLFSRQWREGSGFCRDPISFESHFSPGPVLKKRRVTRDSPSATSHELIFFDDEKVRVFIRVPFLSGM